MKVVFKSPIGIEVNKGDWDGAEWTITGYPSREICEMFEFESAHDFEEYVESHINSQAVTFDSEYSQFFAYAPTKAQAVRFAKAIEKRFTQIKEQIKELKAK